MDIKLACPSCAFDILNSFKTAFNRDGDYFIECGCCKGWFKIKLMPVELVRIVDSYAGETFSYIEKSTKTQN